LLGGIIKKNMTAIIGYTHEKENNRIGVLCTDDLNGWSGTKVDKMSKINNRFAFAIAGLESVHWAIDYGITYLDQFNGSKKSIDSINDLEDELNEIIPTIFRRWKEANFFDNIEKQKDFRTLIVVLDTEDNKLYYSELGYVWKIDELDDYSISMTLLEDGLYLFGVVAPQQDYIKEDIVIENDRDIFKYLNTRFNAFNKEFPKYVGNLGSIQINVNGEIEQNKFYSCFSSYLDYVDNAIKRSEK